MLLFANAVFAQTESELARYFRAYLDVYAKAQPRCAVSDSVAVIGAVNKPGCLPFTEGLTVSQALVTGGKGFQPSADKRHVGVWKSKEGRFDIFSGKISTKDPLLDKGDIVVVISQNP
jgi:protein involved in polysaccharide export with SLBB domain